MAEIKAQTVVRQYKERQRKPDDECSILTLAMRRYTNNRIDYYRNNVERLRATAKQRYENPEYKAKKLANMKVYREKQKQLKMERIENDK